MRVGDEPLLMCVVGRLLKLPSGGEDVCQRVLESLRTANLSKFLVSSVDTIALLVLRLHNGNVPALVDFLLSLDPPTLVPLLTRIAPVLDLGAVSLLSSKPAGPSAADIDAAGPTALFRRDTPGVLPGLVADPAYVVPLGGALSLSSQTIASRLLPVLLTSALFSQGSLCESALHCAWQIVLAHPSLPSGTQGSPCLSVCRVGLACGLEAQTCSRACEALWLRVGSPDTQRALLCLLVTHVDPASVPVPLVSYLTRTRHSGDPDRQRVICDVMVRVAAGGGADATDAVDVDRRNLHLSLLGSGVGDGAKVSAAETIVMQGARGLSDASAVLHIVSRGMGEE
ncbi:hypothetical protein KIPB_005100 [Kipferlia bialata]|uniref:Uncharacterized protein n=1 Tax=Kipferlia bialata TaxID=797122 RepID=A0A391NL86_9EUKA|nr:hypothetical protein KIPB_005100 [Kipferlia bialata]|eukprot:g5100.t1